MEDMYTVTFVCQLGFDGVKIGEGYTSLLGKSGRAEPKPGGQAKNRYQWLQWQMNINRTLYAKWTLLSIDLQLIKKYALFQNGKTARQRFYL